MSRTMGVLYTKSITPATKYAVLRGSDKRKIKAQLAGNGCSIDKSCKAYRILLSPLPYIPVGDAELALIRCPCLSNF